MVAAMQYATTYESPGDNPSYTVGYQIRNHAFLYVITGDQWHAEQARTLVDRLRAQDWDTSQYGNVIGTWYPSDGPERTIRHLNKTQGSLAVAIAYDLCFHAWPEDYRRLISRELAIQGRMQLDAWGVEYPTQGRANNWRGIRFAGAGIALLASDEPHLTTHQLAQFNEQGINPMSRYSDMHGIDPRWIQTSYELVAAYLFSGLTNDFSARGQNLEGQGYVLYPWRLIAPFLLSLERLAGMDIRLDRPAVGWNTQLIATGAVTIPTRLSPLPDRYALGLRPDLSNDNPDYTTQGSMALSFPFLSGDRLAGFRWHYDRVAGELGVGDYELEWGGATWGFLYYPEFIEPMNPAQAWGLTLFDRPTGTVVFRNRFEDQDDAVLMLTARSRGVSNQIHFGADISSLRIIGEGGFFTTGSGRSTQVAGQSNVLRSSATTVSDNRNTPPGIISYLQLRDNGSGSVTIQGSATTVSQHTRRVLVDYEPDASGVTAVYLVADDSTDGDLWRINTPDFNEIIVTDNGFEIVAPNGARLVAHVHYPVNPSIETGSYNRNGTVHYRGLQGSSNQWVQIANPGNTRFIISLQLLSASAEAVDFVESSDGNAVLLELGTSTYRVAPEFIVRDDWPKTVQIATTSVPQGSGVVSGAGTFSPGEVTVLTATPADGYVFAGWDCSDQHTAAPVGWRAAYTLQVSRDLNVTARFVPIDSDDNNNGLPALIESALGLEPGAPVDSRAWYAVDRDASGRFYVAFRRDPGREDIVYRIEASNDLQQWTVLYDSDVNAAVPNTHYGIMRVAAPEGWSDCFVRLGVEQRLD
ncbi:MAG: hypothetical protein LR015_08740 [Verrucomicrobia bacterium]|nr:hypothetical protein [Verrucomicrobiota bacterium]